MSRPVDRQPTVMQVCCAKLGILKGARTCAFITQWAMASQGLGREITREEYADWWKESERTVYRELARFREVFPSLHTPQPFANQAIARAEAVSRGVDGVGALPASLVLA